MAFSGLGLHLGNLSRCRRRRRARSARRISPARRARAAWRPRAPARTPARDSARAGRSRPRSRIEPGRDLHARRHRGPGRDPADLDDAARGRWRDLDPAHLLGRPGRSRRSSARSATSSPAAGSSYAQCRSLAVCVNPGRAFNCYWEMPFRKRAGSRSRTRDRRADDRSTTRSTTR